MKAIILIMLCVQAAMLIVTAYVVAVRRPTAARPGPVWSSLAVSLFVVGMSSNSIGSGHAGSPGADILVFVGAILIGMGLMAAIVLFRERRTSSRNP